MRRLWGAVDDILRGESTKLETARNGDLPIPLLDVGLLCLLMAASYGACMGCFAIFSGRQDPGMQIVASAVKTPLLVVMTLGITFPSLYVFNTLLGSPLGLLAVLRLLMASIAVFLAVLASVGPISAFFSASTESYTFIVLLHVVVFSASGLFGMRFLIQTMQRLCLPPPPETALRIEPVKTSEAETQAAESPSANIDDSANVPATGYAPSTSAQVPLSRQRTSPHVRQVFVIWAILFGTVGAQSGWLLRPFIGDPTTPFVWFRPRQGNIFEAVWSMISRLLQ